MFSAISQSARTHGPDVAKLTAAWAAWFWGVNWNAVGAFLSCVLTALFILDKLGLLSPLKALFVRLRGRVFGGAAA